MLPILLALAAVSPTSQLNVQLQAPRAERIGPRTAFDRSAAANGFQRSRNVVLVLADDFGVDLVAAYGEAPNPPCTPTIDDLASTGILFRNAWANPTCSPTRATTLTGRYGFRTQIGSPSMGAMSLSELTIPEMLTGFQSAAVGKWHLGGNDADHPNDSGFLTYAGSLGGGMGNYSSWNKTINGVTSNVTTYATSDAADEAIQAAETLTEPFFLYLSFNAPHTTLHVPPQELCIPDHCYCDALGQNPSNPEMAKAMVEAMDAELGRALEGIRTVDPDVLVIFMGDNGTARQVTEPPFDQNRAKGSVYEGGVNVPLIVSGTGVAQGECAAMVGAVDLFATIAEWTGNASAADDSVSMVPYFSNPALPSIRETLYTEGFSPNGPGPYTTHDRAVRNADYKLIRRIGDPDELYLTSDALETNDLFPTLVPGTEAHDNYLALVQVLVDLGTD